MDVNNKKKSIYYYKDRSQSSFSGRSSQESISSLGDYLSNNASNNGGKLNFMKNYFWFFQSNNNSKKNSHDSIFYEIKSSDGNKASNHQLDADSEHVMQNPDGSCNSFGHLNGDSLGKTNENTKGMSSRKSFYSIYDYTDESDYNTLKENEPDYLFHQQKTFEPVANGRYAKRECARNYMHIYDTDSSRSNNSSEGSSGDDTSGDGKTQAGGQNTLPTKTERGQAKQGPLKRYKKREERTPHNKMEDLVNSYKIKKGKTKIQYVGISAILKKYIYITKNEKMLFFKKKLNKKKILLRSKIKKRYNPCRTFYYLQREQKNAIGGKKRKINMCHFFRYLYYCMLKKKLQTFYRTRKLKKLMKYVSSQGWRRSYVSQFGRGTSNDALKGASLEENRVNNDAAANVSAEENSYNPFTTAPSHSDTNKAEGFVSVRSCPKSPRLDGQSSSIHELSSERITTNTEEKQLEYKKKDTEYVEEESYFDVCIDNPLENKTGDYKMEGEANDYNVVMKQNHTSDHPKNDIKNMPTYDCYKNGEEEFSICTNCKDVYIDYVKNQKVEKRRNNQVLSEDIINLKEIVLSKKEEHIPDVQSEEVNDVNNFEKCQNSYSDVGESPCSSDCQQESFKMDSSINREVHSPGGMNPSGDSQYIGSEIVGGTSSESIEEASFRSSGGECAGKTSNDAIDEIIESSSGFNEEGSSVNRIESKEMSNKSSGEEDFIKVKGSSESCIDLYKGDDASESNRSRNISLSSSSKGSYDVSLGYIESSFMEEIHGGKKDHTESSQEGRKEDINGASHENCSSASNYSLSICQIESQTNSQNDTGKDGPSDASVSAEECNQREEKECQSGNAINRESFIGTINWGTAENVHLGSHLHVEKELQNGGSGSLEKQEEDDDNDDEDEEDEDDSSEEDEEEESENDEHGEDEEEEKEEKDEIEKEGEKEDEGIKVKEKEVDEDQSAEDEEEEVESGVEEEESEEESDDESEEEDEVDEEVMDTSSEKEEELEELKQYSDDDDEDEEEEIEEIEVEEEEEIEEKEEGIKVEEKEEYEEDEEVVENEGIEEDNEKEDKEEEEEDGSDAEEDEIEEDESQDDIEEVDVETEEEVEVEDQVDVGPKETTKVEPCDRRKVVNSEEEIENTMEMEIRKSIEEIFKTVMDNDILTGGSENKKFDAFWDEEEKQGGTIGEEELADEVGGKSDNQQGEAENEEDAESSETANDEPDQEEIGQLEEVVQREPEYAESEAVDDNCNEEVGDVVDEVEVEETVTDDVVVDDHPPQEELPEERAEKVLLRKNAFSFNTYKNSKLGHGFSMESLSNFFRSFESVNSEYTDTSREWEETEKGYQQLKGKQEGALKGTSKEEQNPTNTQSIQNKSDSEADFKLNVQTSLEVHQLYSHLQKHILRNFKKGCLKKMVKMFKKKYKKMERDISENIKTIVHKFNNLDEALEGVIQSAPKVKRLRRKTPKKGRKKNPLTDVHTDEHWAQRGTCDGAKEGTALYVEGSVGASPNSFIVTDKGVDIGKINRDRHILHAVLNEKNPMESSTGKLVRGDEAQVGTPKQDIRGSQDSLRLTHSKEKQEYQQTQQHLQQTVHAPQGSKDNFLPLKSGDESFEREDHPGSAQRENNQLELNLSTSNGPMDRAQKYFLQKLKCEKICLVTNKLGNKSQLFNRINNMTKKCIADVFLQRMNSIRTGQTVWDATTGEKKIRIGRSPLSEVKLGGNHTMLLLHEDKNKKTAQQSDKEKENSPNDYSLERYEPRPNGKDHTLILINKNSKEMHPFNNCSGMKIDSSQQKLKRMALLNYVKHKLSKSKRSEKGLNAKQVMKYYRPCAGAVTHVCFPAGHPNKSSIITHGGISNACNVNRVYCLQHEDAYQKMVAYKKQADGEFVQLYFPQSACSNGSRVQNNLCITPNAILKGNHSNGPYIVNQQNGQQVHPQWDYHLAFLQNKFQCKGVSGELPNGKVKMCVNKNNLTINKYRRCNRRDKFGTCRENHVLPEGNIMGETNSGAANHHVGKIHPDTLSSEVKDAHTGAKLHCGNSQRANNLKTGTDAAIFLGYADAKHQMGDSTGGANREVLMDYKNSSLGGKGERSSSQESQIRRLLQAGKTTKSGMPTRQVSLPPEHTLRTLHTWNFPTGKIDGTTSFYTHSQLYKDTTLKRKNKKNNLFTVNHNIVQTPGPYDDQTKRKICCNMGKGISSTNTWHTDESDSKNCILKNICNAYDYFRNANDVRIHERGATKNAINLNNAHKYHVKVKKICSSQRNQEEHLWEDEGGFKNVLFCNAHDTNFKKMALKNRNIESFHICSINFPQEDEFANVNYPHQMENLCIFRDF
ncbi:Uncharacterized protein PCOAH_00007740 [Plasmodium coatneyi]|uniref:Uncharacterized protein n=1 Tax=Plasmodium coatneyi TaxID=208452 RepID=A0A1B1DV70_9APIC|nr:Uncharacterized protein PCOAH_00007740 [Plasmodium coatneyi]ANQ06507.1 Uncharacterized protein PCOAH_00007740 [Plasmodium coatneyi]